MLDKLNDLNELLPKDDDYYSAVWDFSASPYALGDILTWNMRACIEALNNAKKLLDVYILLDPKQPSNRHQNYINSNNFHKYINDIFPAFLVNPMLRNIHFLQNRESLEAVIFYKMLSQQVVFPNLKKYLQGYKFSEAIYSSHDKMNEFFNTHHYLPNLTVPASTGSWAKQFLKSYDPKTIFVCVHMRHRQSEIDMSAELFRDANFSDWLEFFKFAQTEYPDVIFVIVGRPVEWPRELFRLTNTLVIKTQGYGLLEELAMVQECDLFMATNSGPAVMAVFGSRPYVIFQHPGNAEVSAKLWGIHEGEKRLPFAKKHQTIKWGVCSTQDLISSFEEKYRSIFNK